MTQAQNLASWSQQFADLSNVLANRNYIVDGNFDAWQIAVSGNIAIPANSFTVGALTMFYLSTAVGAGAAVTRNQYSPGGHPPGLTTPVWNTLTYQQSTAGGGSMFQRIESVDTLAGKSATFSCWLWVASGTITITSLVGTQVFGSGGSPSPNVSFNPAVNWVVTTTPQRFSVRIDVPGINGKTLGTSGNDFVQFGINFPATGTFYVGTVQWQLEQSSPNSSSDLNGAGGAPTPFEYRGQAAEAARVTRYWETSYDPGVPPGTANATGGASLVFVSGLTAGVRQGGVFAPYKATKRGIPVVSTYSTITGASGMARDYGTNTDVATTVTNSGANGFSWYSTTGSSTQVNLQCQWTADGRL